jgi:ABC-type nitrate/sulfonate/bicarbonate transport system substrate-binding protein
VTFVPIPQPQLEQVLLQGGVDAIIAYSPLYAQLTKKGYRPLFHWSDLAGRVVQRGGTMVSDDFIAAHPDLVRDYVAAIADAADWANTHQAEVVKLGIERGEIEADIAPYLYNRQGKPDYSAVHWASHGLVKADDVGFWLGVVERENIVPKNRYRPADFFTNDYNPYAGSAKD